jgi:hypothetical protein
MMMAENELAPVTPGKMLKDEFLLAAGQSLDRADPAQ